MNNVANDWIVNWVQWVKSLYSKCTDIVISVVYYIYHGVIEFQSYWIEWEPIFACVAWALRTVANAAACWGQCCRLRASAIAAACSVASAEACCGQCCRLGAAAIAAACSVACALWPVLRPVAVSAAARAVAIHGGGALSKSWKGGP